MKKVYFFIFSFLLILTLPVLSADKKTNKKEMQDVPDFIGYVPNEIVIKFDRSITTKKDKKSAPKGKLGIPSLDQVGERYNVISVLPQFPEAKRKKYKGREIDLSGWHKIKFGREVDVKAVIKEYKKIPGVIDAQPIGIYPLNSPSFPNDGYFQWQWHLNQANDADIDAPEAWGAIFGNGGMLDNTLIVAVLDTGVRYFHKDLGGSNASLDDPENTDGNMWINLPEKNDINPNDPDDDGNGYNDDWIGYDFVDGVTEIVCDEFLGIPITCPCLGGEDCEDPDNDPRDFNGHGTHVAGIVAAINNNGYGTASTAGGWGDETLQPIGNGVKIMPLRICWSAYHWLYELEVGLCRMDFAAEALYYAADNGANFVNASWGSGNDGGIADAIDYFLASGGMIFKAAGNDCLPPPFDESCETADYINGRTDPGIISVAATDSNDCKAGFSNYGTWVDISAPGTDIWSAYHVYYEPEYDQVAQLSGTSMASPLALSVAALIWSEYPTLTAFQVEQRLKDSSDYIDGLGCNSSYADKLGAGRVNAKNAVNITCSIDDVDGDLYSPCEGDCNDNDAAVNPGATEIVDNGKDDDCNPATPDSSLDIDNDGDGYTENDGDCDDTDASVNPGATEVCNNVDDNCDTNIDEGVEPATFYRDFDGDNYGNSAQTTVACTAPNGYVSDNTDCNDNDANVNPGATEIVDNGKDDDCNPATPDSSLDIDNDGDGYTENDGDCDDTDASVNPGATEVCNNVDDNCDGGIDEGLSCGTVCGNETCELGEDCSSCPDDCIGQQTGKPSSRYCCGDGACKEGVEDNDNCAIDCESGQPPSCGDGTCDPGESQTSCPDDCPGVCSPKGFSCESNAECCSNKCRKNKCR